MARRVAIIGTTVALAGLLVQVWWDPAYPPTNRSGPLESLITAALQFTPLLGQTCVTAGAVILAVALLARPGGRDPLLPGVSTPLWLGLVMLGLVTAVEYFLQYSPSGYQAMQEIPVRWFETLSVALHFVTVMAASLIGLWLTALITTRPGRGRSDRATGIPSRPF